MSTIADYDRKIAEFERRATNLRTRATELRQEGADGRKRARLLEDYADIQLASARSHMTIRDRLIAEQEPQS